jgi:hypothetical protein
MSDSGTFACWVCIDGKWHHIVCLHDAANRAAIVVDNHSCPVDTQAYWARALTPEECTALYEAGKGVGYDELRGMGQPTPGEPATGR